jgi:predicted site-specific integrase-resolvase
MMLPKLLKVSGLAEITGIANYQTWAKWRREGRFEAVQVGGQWFVTEAELARYLSGQPKQTTMPVVTGE